MNQIGENIDNDYRRGVRQMLYKLSSFFFKTFHTFFKLYIRLHLHELKYEQNGLQWKPQPYKPVEYDLPLIFI